ncbi:MAG: sigma-70 family RNA polymerase sigma factor [Dehalococcoidia bacterium]
MRDTNGASDDGGDGLVARLRALEPAALEELYLREGRRAFALAYRVLGDPGAAEDAVQEAFAQLWEGAPRLSLAGRVESLLMTIVHRRAVDLVRSRRRREAPSAPPAALDRVDEQAQALLENVVEAVSSEGLRARLRATLAGLPEEQRTVVTATYFEGLTLREVAERERVPLGTVKSRLRLAMQKLGEAVRVEVRP